jgi:hypothetical protein
MQAAHFVAASSCAATFFPLEEREMCNQLDMLQECRRMPVAVLSLYFSDCVHQFSKCGCRRKLSKFDQDQ